MAIRQRKKLLCAATAIAAGVASAGERVPTILEAPPPRAMSARFDAPDWLTHANVEYQIIERLLYPLHPRQDAAAFNVPIDVRGDGFGLPSLCELCDAVALARYAEVVPFSGRTEAWSRRFRQEPSDPVISRPLPARMADLDIAPAMAVP